MSDYRNIELWKPGRIIFYCLQMPNDLYALKFPFKLLYVGLNK